MKLLYLTESNLKDRLFVRDLVHNFKFEEKALLLHAPSGTVQETRFAGRRLSSLFSETMVYNLAFGGDQRGLLRQGAGGLSLAEEALRALMANVQLLILSPLALGAEGPVQADPEAVLGLLRARFGAPEVLLFPANPLSPLGGKKPRVEAPEDAARLMALYEEEAPLIRQAERLMPAQIVSPVNYAL